MSSPTTSGASAAAAAAADARLRAAAALRDTATGGLDESAFKLKVKRIVDKEICASASSEVASKCMRLFHTLLSNIVDHPTEGKFRAFKTEQPRIKRELLSVYGAKDLLVLLLFRTRTAEFKEEWYFAETYQPGCEAWRKLELARSALGEYARVKEDTAERLREIAEREKVAEQTRVARAMAAAEEDRERVRQRAEREKHARQARQSAAAAQAQAAAQQGGDPASEQAKAEPADHKGYRPVGHYDEDEEEGSDEGSEPDFGTGAGRRLGD